MTTAEKYVTAAYCVVFGVVLAWDFAIAPIESLERCIGCLREIEADGARL